MTKEDVSEDVRGEAVLGWASTHQRPVVHQVASAPMPSDCEFSFFDPSEPQCRELLRDPSTTIPELFAVLRQWVPQVQKNIHLIGSEILKRGCGVNDRDGLTDMTLLHYCCKAGAPGIGDAETAAGFARQLLGLGADPNLRSRWTNMRALHYAAYFDVPQLIRVVLPASQPGEIDATCSDFDFGTALHIAASNLCLSAVKCLLELRANPAFRNEKGQSPADVVPDPLDVSLEMAESAATAKELRLLLRQALPRPGSPLPLSLHPQAPPPLSDKARAQLAGMGLRLGQCVVIAGQKVGTLRFCGSTEFSGGLWAGVELDRPEGKNDGSVAGVQYFTCRMKHGIFAPLSKISKPSERTKNSGGTKTSTPVRPPRSIDVARVSSAIHPGVLCRSLSSSSSSLDSRPGPTARTRPLPRQRPPARPRRHRVLQSPRTAPPALQRPPPPPPPPPAPDATLHRDLRSRTPSASSSVSGGPEVRLGERVLVVGQRTGVVQFYGRPASLRASGLESNWTSPAARTTARWAESDTSAAHPNTACSLLHHGFKGSTARSTASLNCRPRASWLFLPPERSAGASARRRPSAPRGRPAGGAPPPGVAPTPSVGAAAPSAGGSPEAGRRPLVARGSACGWACRCCSTAPTRWRWCATWAPPTSGRDSGWDWSCGAPKVATTAPCRAAATSPAGPGTASWCGPAGSPTAASAAPTWWPRAAAEGQFLPDCNFHHSAPFFKKIYIYFAHHFLALIFSLVLFFFFFKRKCRGKK